MPHFQDLYQSHSNLELLRILENARDYQPEALEAANKIFISRQVGPDELQTLKEELARQDQKKSEQEVKSKFIENKIKEVSAKVIDNVNPIQPQGPSAEKTILILSIVLGFLFLRDIYSSWGFFRYMLFDSDSIVSITELPYFVPIILFPLGIILFWYRKKAGWWILSVYLGCSALASIVSPIVFLFFSSGSLPMDGIMGSVNLSQNFWSVVVNGGFLLVLCKQNVRNVYAIDKKKMYLSLGSAFVIVLVFLSLFSMLLS